MESSCASYLQCLALPLELRHARWPKQCSGAQAALELCLGLFSYSSANGYGIVDGDGIGDGIGAVQLHMLCACAAQRRRGSDRRALRARLPEPRVPGAPARHVPGAHGARVHHAGARARRLLRAVLRAAQRGPPAPGLLRPLRRHRRARRCALLLSSFFFCSLLLLFFFCSLPLFLFSSLLLLLFSSSILTYQYEYYCMYMYEHTLLLQTITTSRAS